MSAEWIDGLDHPELEIVAALNTRRTYSSATARDELEWLIAEHLAEVRRHHSPDDALDAAMDILDEVLEAFDREVAKAYLRGVDDTKDAACHWAVDCYKQGLDQGRKDERAKMNNELFNVRVEAFSQGVQAALNEVDKWENE
jgi:hypothetical protein